MGISKVEQQRVSLLLGNQDAASVEKTYQGLIIDEFGESLTDKFNKICIYAGLNLKNRNIFLLRVAFWTGLALVVLLASGEWLYGLLACTPLYFEWSGLKKKARKRARLFEQDYCAFLLSIASSVKSGADPILALSQAINLFPAGSIINEQVVSFKTDLETGLSEEEALRKFAGSIDNSDIDMFRSAMIIARKEGSALGECLQRLAKVTRQRQSFVRKVKSAVAMQKMASIGIAACTVAIGLIQYFANPDALVKAWNHPVGFPVMITGLGLIATGLIWMRKLAGREM